MSSLDRPSIPTPPESDDERPQGPNLVVVYSILAVVLLVAMGIAALIVLPFYLRR